MGKLILTKKEKEIMQRDGMVVITRAKETRVPPGSMKYGEGNEYLWDKVDRKWVYGNVSKYINAMVNVGRRFDDYPHNNPNRNSGSNWWENHGSVNEWNPVGEVITTGRSHIYHYSILNVVVDELVRDGGFMKVMVRLSVVDADTDAFKELQKQFEFDAEQD